MADRDRVAHLSRRRSLVRLIDFDRILGCGAVSEHCRMATGLEKVMTLGTRGWWVRPGCRGATPEAGWLQGSVEALRVGVETG
jgi:hypothetical protein